MQDRGRGGAQFGGAPPPGSEAAIRAEIISRLSQKGRLGNCTLCGVRLWALGDFIAMTVTPWPLQPGPSWGATLPLITFSCQNCGNTHFINLLTLGYTMDQLRQMNFQQFYAR